MIDLSGGAAAVRVAISMHTVLSSANKQWYAHQLAFVFINTEPVALMRLRLALHRFFL